MRVVIYLKIVSLEDRVMRKPLKERLGKEWLFCDGGMGTILQKKGLKGGELPETWNLKRPDDIMDLHLSYLNVGVNIFNTNTFGANRLKYPNNLEEVVRAAVRIAKEARTRSGRKDDAYIALDIGPTGKLLEPLGELPFKEAIDIFAEVIRYGADEGADLVLIESMCDAYEAKAAILAAKENCDLPVLITTIYDEKGKLLTGGTVESTVAMLEGLKVDALGVNCGLGPKQMKPIVEKLVKVTSVPVIVNPNAGLPRSENGQTVFDVGPDEFAMDMAKIAELGIHIAGGCCGTTPEHIKREIETLEPMAFIEPVPKKLTVISSYCSAVNIGEKPLIIGERINPTGKKRFQQALREKDYEYILNEGLKQENSGAHILDVNVGLPDIDEGSMMEEVVDRLQSITGLPLQIDTTDADALERGMRTYNGKPLINSVNGKQEIMDMVFPLVAKYGGVIVCLPIDEGGIPETADGRIEVSKKIINEASKYGIPRSDLVIDGLAMTISSDPKGALVTLETVKRAHDELGCSTILGVSNISFGLPHREIVNSYFYAMAMHNGLSLGIINPGSEAMMSAYRAYMALKNLDDNCMEYINFATSLEDKVPVSAAGTKGGPNASDSSAKTAGSDDNSPTAQLRVAIERGLKDQAASAAKECLSSMDPLLLINDILIPSLDTVGKGFEKGTVFLPQLLMSAEASKAAFAVIKESLSDTPQKIRGRIILATVKGDIHDIGKNIVKVLLENYGYEILDLGKDVSPETICETAIKENIKLVGLSALMTTTVTAMEETIKLLRKKSPQTKVVVGGAVLTQEYADQIGADAYAKDAMATVHFADTIFER